MTYHELAQALSKLTPEQLNQDVTVYIREQDEFCPLVKDYPVCESEVSDVLDKGHKYLVI